MHMIQHVDAMSGAAALAAEEWIVFPPDDPVIERNANRMQYLLLWINLTVQQARDTA
jgi:hypothetical protein